MNSFILESHRHLLVVPLSRSDVEDVVASDEDLAQFSCLCLLTLIELKKVKKYRHEVFHS